MDLLDPVMIIYTVIDENYITLGLQTVFLYTAELIIDNAPRILQEIDIPRLML